MPCFLFLQVYGIYGFTKLANVISGTITIIFSIFTSGIYKMLKRKQKIYFQPKDTGLCGQYSVANLIQCTPDESIRAFGKKGGKRRKSGTATKDLYKGLQALGYHSNQRMSLIKPDTSLPELCLISVIWKGPSYNSGLSRSCVGHWVAYKNGIIICSCLGIYKSLNSYIEKTGGVATAFLEVKKY